jgi:PadR family transcriptional regulator, regulatory protein PadR
MYRRVHSDTTPAPPPRSLDPAHGQEPASGGPLSINKDLVAATSTPLVLAILAEGDSYGYAILRRVRELSGGELEWTDGMLYPVLHRLERSGLVESRWEKTESGRRRKYYRVTAAGREHLADERRQWRTVDQTLRNVWSALADPALGNPSLGDGSLVPLPHRA